MTDATPIIARALDEVLLRASEGGGRVSDAEALAFLERGDLAALGAAAHAVRMRLHPDAVATYGLERNINYSNVCAARCDFCGFSARPADRERGWVISREDLDAKISELTATGGRQILLQGGLHPSLPLEWYEDLLRHIKAAHGVHIHGFSPPEIHWMSRLSGLGLGRVLERLRAAGLDSIPGGGAEILVDSVRTRISENKATTAEWLAVMRAAAAAGLRGTATMMFGHVETPAERVEHLARLRELQDETGVFTAFISWPFQCGPGLRLQCPTAGGTEYLRMTALARLHLDNIPHFQASWVTQGDKIGQMALLFGCDDIGTTMMEEKVVSAAGTTFRMGENELRRLIAGAGFEPARRDFFYNRAQ